MNTFISLLATAILLVGAGTIRLPAQPGFPTAQVSAYSPCDPGTDLWETTTAIAPDGQRACLVLDGSGSTGSGGELRYAWYVGAGAELVSTNARAAVCLPVGTSDVAFSVAEGPLARFTQRRVEVISPETAVDRLGATVMGAGLPAGLTRTLLAPLERVDAFLAVEDSARAIRWLESFQRVARRRAGSLDGPLAAEWIASAEQLIRALECDDER